MSSTTQDPTDRARWSRRAAQVHGGGGGEVHRSGGRRERVHTGRVRRTALPGCNGERPFIGATIRTSWRWGRSGDGHAVRRRRRQRLIAGMEGIELLPCGASARYATRSLPSSKRPRRCRSSIGSPTSTTTARCGANGRALCSSTSSSTRCGDASPTTGRSVNATSSRLCSAVMRLRSLPSGWNASPWRLPACSTVDAGGVYRRGP